ARRVMSPRLPIGVDTTYSVPAAGEVIYAQEPASAVDLKIVTQLLLQERAQLARDARLQLPHPLPGNTELIAQLLQGQGVLRHHALVEDDGVLARQGGAEALQLIVQDRIELRVRRILLRALRARGQELHPRHAGALPIADR